ncbi:MAG: hypothetical protein J0L94_01815 [Rhodothermia bacterium]|nr:hypothetical protein [Rhodothermia bacterium]
MYQNREELTQVCVHFLTTQTTNAKVIETHATDDHHVWMAISGMDGYFVVLAECHGDATDPQPDPEAGLKWLQETESIRHAAAYALSKGGFLRYQLLGIAADENNQMAVHGIGQSPKIEWERVFSNMSDVYTELHTAIEALAGQIEATDNLRDMVGHVKDLRDKLKLATVQKDQRDKLFELLNQTSDLLRVKLDAERAELNETSQATFEKYQPLVDAWSEKADTVEEFKNSREELVALQKEVREARMLREHRATLLDKLDLAFKVLRKRQQADWSAFEAECEANYNTLAPQFANITASIESATEFRPIRDQLIELQRHVREAKLFRDKRKAFFDQLDELFEKIRVKVEEEKSHYDEKAEANMAQCQVWVDEVLQIVNNTAEGDDYQAAKKRVKELTQEVFNIQPLRMKQKRAFINAIKEAEDRLYTNSRAFYEKMKIEREARNRDREMRDRNYKQRLTDKVSRKEDAISRIENNIEMDRKYLEDIETKLEFVFKGKNVGELRATYEQKMEEIKKRIEENKRKIKDIRKEITELKQPPKDEAAGDQTENTEAS